MNMKHTKLTANEYKLEFNIKDNSTAQEDWPKYRIDSQYATVAEIHGDANEALGHLFAAAPELLAALYFLTDVFVSPEADNKLKNAAYLAARRAIAKAEGEVK